MKDIRKLPHRTAPRIIPEELIEQKFCCPSCKTEIPVAWIDKLPFPKQPVQPNTGEGHWVPVGFPIYCPMESCKKERAQNRSATQRRGKVLPWEIIIVI
jgi:hypothetical protein